ncbi:MAG TPA: cation:proton antiporter [Streptosporangiaceae bacterium]|nr:cation:proton antiporter [Streptosporangiaceae bacterium]
MSTNTVLVYVLADIAVVVAASALLGIVARRLGQPTVVGQIITGILLGASFLGRLPGNLEKHLFPAAVVPYLTVLSQVAVVIFMFVVGYEIDLRRVRGLTKAVPAVAVAAFAVPMALGAGFAWAFGSGTGTFGPHVSGAGFVLFMGVATSITALPVLAAIVRERGIAGLPASIVAMTSAGAMDVVAWVMLAVAMTEAKPTSGRPWWLTLVLILAFVVFMLVVVRRVLGWWQAQSRSLLAGQVPIALTLAIGSAWVTASLGLHPVFGGFLAGMTMRRQGQAPDADVLRFMESAGGVLLPLFFVITGLSVVIGTLHAQDLVLLAALCLIATAGKLGPAYGASRFSGLDHRQSTITAVLVNTRGLTELIALTVGLQAGIIGTRLFTVLVLMALVTTLMTGPLLTLVSRSRQPSQLPEAQPADLTGS